MAGDVELRGITKRFGHVTAVDDVTLHVRSGEFFSLLGACGCGKTTTLRLIAGFEQPTAGSVLLDGSDMTSTPAHKRKVNTVFQSYALFPYLSVFENVAFGLRRRRTPKAELRKRVEDMLHVVHLDGLDKRMPSQLSGGQQQRVALARALVLEPSVLLLDEPLGALDAKLRKTLQLELKSLQERVGVTFVYVTHDQEEALTMSDRIAVMSDGRIEQVATPKEIYEEPSTLFVADFLGVSNLMPATAVASENGDLRVRMGTFELLVRRGDVDARGDVKIVIRPERVLVAHFGDGGENRLPGMVERVVYLGSAEQLVIRLATGDTVQALVPNDGATHRFEQGTPVHVHLPAESLRALSA
jgi:spermidine/putrescine transport system ATP-binding protein